MNPMLKPSGTERLKLKSDGTAFKFWFQVQLVPLHLGDERHADLHIRVGPDGLRDGGQGRGLHSLTSKLNLRTFGNTSLTLKLNLSTFGPHPRVNLGCVGTK
jgi:hypothetical protein